MIDVAIDGACDHTAAERAELVGMQRTGSRPPLFLIRTWHGEIAQQRTLARHLDSEQPIYSVAPPRGDKPEDFPADAHAWAELALSRLLTVPHTGPYLVGGWSFGGVIALEVGERLVRKGFDVALIAMLDTRRPKPRPQRRRGRDKRSALHKSVKRLDRFLELGTGRERLDYLRRRAARRREKLATRFSRLRGRSEPRSEPVSISLPGAAPDDQGHVGMTGRRMSLLRRAVQVGYLKYRSGGSALPVLQLRTAQSEAAMADATLGWGPWLHGDLETSLISGDHVTMFEEPHVVVLAQRLSDALERASAKPVLDALRAR